MSAFELIVAQEYVKGHEDPGAKFRSIPAQALYLRNGVAGIFSRTELRPCYIHSIGTAVYSRDADICISRRSEKFNLSHY